MSTTAQLPARRLRPGAGRLDAGDAVEHVPKTGKISGYMYEDDISSDEEEDGIKFEDIYIPPPMKNLYSENSNDPRLVINYLIVENFKSFSGRCKIGPFDKDFSAIIGPNGSGKSNVIDSLLFVFGYRASKLRVPKLSQFIHAFNPKLTSCRVEIHFQQVIDREDRYYDVVPNSTFVISRTAHKSGQSAYEIDGRQVLLKQVVAKLRNYGIDLKKNRFLILQGEVEKIALMKEMGDEKTDVGMLEYVDDILGTARYKAPLKKLKDQIDSLNLEQVEKLEGLKINEAQLNDLHKPMEEFITYMNLENEITLLKNKLYQVQIYQIEKSTEGVKKKESELTRVLKETKEKLGKLEESRSLGKENTSHLKKTIEQNSQKLEDLQKVKYKNEMKIHSLKSELEYVEKNKEINETKLEKENEKSITLAEDLEKLENELEEKKTEQERKRKIKDEKESRLKAIEAVTSGNTKALVEERDGLYQEYCTLKSQVQTIEEQLASVNSEFRRYQDNCETGKTRLAKLTDVFTTNKNELLEYEKNIKKLENESKEKRALYESIGNELMELQVKEVKLKKDIDDSSAKLRETRFDMAKTQSSNNVLNFLMKMKQERKITGIFGRLGDLGGVDDKFDIAVSTACGVLNYIICDTTKTINKCIAALRENSVGEGQFLALDKIEHLRNKWKSSKLNMPGVPRLFDQVKVLDERVLTAFYFGLRETLVAKDITEARKLAYRPDGSILRVVTYDGDIIEISGTMAGGGRPLKGRMGKNPTVITDDSALGDLDKVEEKIKEMMDECDAIKDRISILKKDHYLGRNEIDEIERNLEINRKNIASLRERCSLDEREIIALKKSVENSSTDNERIVLEYEEKIGKLREDLEKAQEGMNTIGERLENVKENINTILGKDAVDEKQELSEAEAEFKTISSAVTALGVKIAACKKKNVTVVKSIGDLKKKLVELEENEKMFNNHFVVTTKQLEVLSKEIKDLEEKLEEDTEKIQEIEEKHSEMVEECEKLKELEKQYEKELKIAIHELETATAELPNIKNDMEALNLHDVPKLNYVPVLPKFFESSSSESEEMIETAEDNTLRILSPDELEQMNFIQIETRIKRKIENLPADKPNPNLQKIYEQKTQECRQQKELLDELTKNVKKKVTFWKKTEEERIMEFKKGFHVLTHKVKEVYMMLTFGGDAELKLVDPASPYYAGIAFCVKPPKKPWKSIMNLSGGEKTLSSLALVLASHYCRPTPFYVMDEIDAALDTKNCLVVGNFIKNHTKHGQFIVVSLRNQLYNLANKLSGIYKVKNAASSLTINIAEFKQSTCHEDIMEYESQEHVSELTNITA